MPLVKKVKVNTVIDKKEKELRFDGSTRFMVLPNNRLMILMQNQDKYIAHFIQNSFDMGDVAKVNFVKIQTHLNIVPSCISFQPLLN